MVIGDGSISRRLLMIGSALLLKVSRLSSKELSAQILIPRACRIRYSIALAIDTTFEGDEVWGIVVLSSMCIPMHYDMCMK